MNFYDLTYRTPQGKEVSMEAYKGKAVLIVNTATKCGLAPQFKELEALHQEYRDSGLVVIGFPCNQFRKQEPETNESMEESCELNFGVTFQLTEKVDVNGKNTHPVFAYLKDQLPGRRSGKIKWNFTKFLITPEGIPLQRYAPIIRPKAIEHQIRAVLPIAKPAN